MKTALAMSGLILSLTLPVEVRAQEPGTAPVPPQIMALSGCWHGSGQVMGKPVSIDLEGKAIVQGALFLVETQSQAIEDPADRYAAHLIFGGSAAVASDGSAMVTGFFADSFGGDYTATGKGQVMADGFVIGYDFPEARFINHWTTGDDGLDWTIIARDQTGQEREFARYRLERGVCARG